MRICLCVVALALAAHAAEMEVSELSDETPTFHNGGSDTHPPPSAGGVGTGYFESFNNFPGPKHGLPGYKESHNWEDDVDLMSPLVFDYRMYRALIKEKTGDAESMSEEALKTHWMKQVEEKQWGDCPQGNLFFNANGYYDLHKAQTEISMGGKACKLIMKTYLEKGVFSGYATARHQGKLPATANVGFPTIATRLFDGVNQRAATVSAAYFEVQSGQYFRTPNDQEDRADNTFSPARHMTLAYWLQIAPQSKAPNAELFAYGAKAEDNYYRTGFGCITKDISDNEESKCYFIMVFETPARREYFHTFAEDNFEPMNKAFMNNKWAHVIMMLTTRNPGFVPDVEAGEGCPNNKLLGGNICYGSLHLYVNKKDIALVDWNEGTDTKYAKAWNDAVSKNIWEKKMDKLTGLPVERRFFVAPVQSCDSDVNRCGEIPQNALKFAFPWHGAYKTGVWFCDFHAVPSGEGAFGNQARRELAINAFYEIMSETKALACQHSTEGDAAVTNDVEASDAPDGAVSS